eukprot:TRINITY_DN30695_c0_g1_i1.p1 TRINITY_DN30695_c0_g1~~TRINITY_DN30695_c0_g1_i1.p1  ORF type:complete len:111 (-),score=28.78 TRINITY_DN30695_c0_g1_i1:103-435(-)
MDSAITLAEQERLNAALRKAASLCDLHAVRRALARGADVNSRARDQLGQAALHLASQWRCKPDVGEALLAAGADTGQQCDMGFTAFDRAKSYGNFKMARLLEDFSSGISR